MSKNVVYGVFDRKNNKFVDLCFAPKDEDITRIWSMTVNNDMVGNPIYSYFPSDFEVVRLAHVDMDSGDVDGDFHDVVFRLDEFKDGTDD